MNEYLKTCPICTAEFTTAVPSKLYCSDECVKTIKQQREAAKNYGIPRVCPICGKPFEGTGNKAKYCSKVCSSIACKKKQQSKKQPIPCIICGSFIPPHKSKICSDSCRATHKAKEKSKYDVEYRKNHPRPKKQKVEKPEVVKTSPVKMVLNKRAKNGTESIEHMKFLSANAPTNDAHILKHKHIKSPDLNRMEFSIRDERMRCTYYFSSLAKYNRFIDRNAQAEEPVSLKKGGRIARQPINE